MGGRGWRVGGGVERKVIIRRDQRRRFVEEKFVSIMLSGSFAIKKEDKTKVRKVWIKSHTSHEPNKENVGPPFSLAIQDKYNCHPKCFIKILFIF